MHSSKCKIAITFIVPCCLYKLSQRTDSVLSSLCFINGYLHLPHCTNPRHSSHLCHCMLLHNGLFTQHQTVSIRTMVGYSWMFQETTEIVNIVEVAKLINSIYFGFFGLFFECLDKRQGNEILKLTVNSSTFEVWQLPISTRNWIDRNICLQNVQLAPW